MSYVLGGPLPDPPLSGGSVGLTAGGGQFNPAIIVVVVVVQVVLAAAQAVPVVVSYSTVHICAKVLTVKSDNRRKRRIDKPHFELLLKLLIINSLPFTVDVLIVYSANKLKNLLIIHYSWLDEPTLCVCAGQCRHSILYVFGFGHDFMSVGH